MHSVRMFCFLLAGSDAEGQRVRKSKKEKKEQKEKEKKEKNKSKKDKKGDESLQLNLWITARREVSIDLLLLQVITLCKQIDYSCILYLYINILTGKGSKDAKAASEVNPPDIQKTPPPAQAASSKG